jgi:hypothetical protein
VRTALQPDLRLRGRRQQQRDDSAVTITVTITITITITITVTVTVTDLRCTSGRHECDGREHRSSYDRRDHWHPNVGRW